MQMFFNVFVHKSLHCKLHVGQVQYQEIYINTAYWALNSLLENVLGQGTGALHEVTIGLFSASNSKKQKLAKG